MPAKPGADAHTPAQIPATGWKQIAKRTWQEGNDDNVDLIAAGVAFYGFSAFVPLLAALVLTYGLVANPANVVEHVRSLTNVMPQDAARLIGEQLQAMVTSAGTSKGFGLLLALGIALWGAMKGATSMMTALNIAFDAQETRSYVKRTLGALALTAGAILALIVAIFAISAMTAMDSWLPFSSPAVHLLLRILFWMGAAAIVSVLIATLYRYGPSRPNPRWVWLTPGSILATLLWIAASLGFGIYVSNFGNYNATYGSLGAIIVFLTWLYLSAYIILMSAELNAETERQTDKDVTAR